MEQLGIFICECQLCRISDAFANAVATMISNSIYASRLATFRVEKLAIGDPVQPCYDRACAAKAVEIYPRASKRVLGQVFGLVLIVTQMEQQSINALVVVRHELRAGILISRQDPLD